MDEWISTELSLPIDKFKKYIVKTKHGHITKCFFMPDKVAFFDWYGLPKSYWLEIRSAELVHHVTHWKEMPIEENCKEIHPSENALLGQRKF